MAAPSFSGGQSRIFAAGTGGATAHDNTEDPATWPFSSGLNGHTVFGNLGELRNESGADGLTACNHRRGPGGGLELGFTRCLQDAAILDLTGDALVLAYINGGGSTTRFRTQAEEAGIMVFVDTAGNWAAQHVIGSDAIFDGTGDSNSSPSLMCVQLSDPSQFIDREGIVDFSAIDRIYYGGLYSGSSTATNAIQPIVVQRPFIQTAGDGTEPGTFGSFFDEISTNAVLPRYLSRQGGIGAALTSAVVFQIGDGATPTHFADENQSLFFRSTDITDTDPASSPQQQCIKIADGNLGLIINQSPGDLVTIDNTQFKSNSTLFQLTVSADPGAVCRLTGCTFIRAIPTFTGPAELFSCIFARCSQIDMGAANLSGSRVGDCSDTGGAVLFDADGSLSGVIFDGNQVDLRIPASAPAAITLSDVTFDTGVADVNIIDLRPGNPTISIAGNGNTPTVRNEGGGTTAIIAGATLTITDLTPGMEVRIYEYPDATATDFGSELAGTEDVPGTTFQFSHSRAGQQVLIQIIGTTEGVEEINLVRTLAAQDESVQATIRAEENV